MFFSWEILIVSIYSICWGRNPIRMLQEGYSTRLATLNPKQQQKRSLSAFPYRPAYFQLFLLFSLLLSKLWRKQSTIDRLAGAPLLQTGATSFVLPVPGLRRSPVSAAPDSKLPGLWLAETPRWNLNSVEAPPPSQAEGQQCCCCDSGRQDRHKEKHNMRIRKSGFPQWEKDNNHDQGKDTECEGSKC